MDRHASSQELSDFLAGRLASRSRNRDVVKHLVAGCPNCIERLQSLDHKEPLPGFLRKRLAKREGSTPRPDPAAFDYDRAFANVERSWNFFIAGDRPVDEPPGSLLAELGSVPEDSGSISCAPTPERSALPFLVRWLVEKSHSCRYTSPDEMLQWALMARIAADTCSKAIAGNAAKLADLRTHAEAQLANTLRVLARSEEAELIMRSSWEYLAKGTGDLTLRASILEKASSLLRLQRRFAAAVEHAQEASAIFDELGMKHERSRVQ